LNIDAQQGQRFDDFTRMGTILNKIITKRVEKPYDPLANLNPNTILLGNREPDIIENTFDGGINEGAPKDTKPLPTSNFAVDEEEPVSPKLQPRKPLGRKPYSPSLRAQTIIELGLGPPPKQKAERPELVEYYRLVKAQTGEPENINVYRSKEALFEEIYRIIDKAGEGK
jgi:hypothetical protein